MNVFFKKTAEGFGSPRGSILFSDLLVSFPYPRPFVVSSF
jgi:hypothetical protein